MSDNFACVILAAGQGSRMKSKLPKPMHKVAGRAMLKHVIAVAEQLNPDKIVVVIGKDMDSIAAEVAPHTTVIQQVANGTGGAVIPAKSALEDYQGDIMVLYGDSPLITPQTVQNMINKRREKPGTGVVFSAMHVQDPKTYGRMVLNDDGSLDKIVEFKDASEAEKKITTCNGGLVCADGSMLFKWLDQLNNDNAQGEYYLTDLPQIARRDNQRTEIVSVDPLELSGANSRIELAELEKLMQERLRHAAMLNGATLIDPPSVFFSYDTQIGQDVVIGPNVVFGENVNIDHNVTIEAFCHIEGAHIQSGACIGPYARLRPGADIGENAKVGNFVELKKTKLGKGSKASHLSYLGDSEIGENVNIGAGTITCNYDGFFKYQTVIKDGAFIGSNSALVAPVIVEAGTIIGAGSTITKNTQNNSLVVARGKQVEIKNWASTFRNTKSEKKAALKNAKA